VRSIRRQHLRHDLIDFASGEPAGGFTFDEHLRVGPVTLTHCISCPVEGRYLASSQVLIATHEGRAFEVNWREADSDRIQSTIITHGHTHVGDARLPLWVRYSASPSFFALALDEAFVTEISQKAFDQGDDFAIRTSFGVQDPVIARLAALGWRELSEGGPGGRFIWRGLLPCWPLCAALLRLAGAFSDPPQGRTGASTDAACP
jgi:hypothetical protein